MTDGGTAARTIGKYVVKRELGRGGMGAVYLAEQPGLGREVAIKELIASADADPTALTRFLQEAQVMARITHPNIVQVYDLEQVDEARYIILEYVAGGALREEIRSGQVPLAKAFAVMHGLLQALNHAHRHSIVHRDVKPENVMMSTEGEVKVADFGIARLTDASEGSTATKTGTTVGTPQYMSPEQVTTSKVDGRSDLYSAGIILYELVCGRPPFIATAEDGPFTLMAKHVQSPPPPPTMLRPGLDPELENVILKALSKRPEDRYQTGQEFDDAVSRVADRLTPGWRGALEPGADLAKMVPGAATAAPGDEQTMILGAMPAAAPLDIKTTIANAAYAPPPPPREGTTAAPVRPAPAPVATAPAAPAAPAAGPNRQLLIIGAVIAVLAIIGVIAFVAMSAGRSNNTGVNNQPSTPAGGGGSCEYLNPGASLASGEGATDCVVLGDQVLSVPFAGQSTLPADLKTSGFDRNGNPVNVASAVKVSLGQATVTSSTQGLIVALLSTETASNSVVIADFTPSTAGDADIGLGVRCGAAANKLCDLVSVSPIGKYRFSYLPDQGLAAQLEAGNGPQVKLNQVNRLVVAVQGQQIKAWLNGSFLASVTSPNKVQPGSVLFFVTDQDPAAPATVGLSQLAVFSPR